MEKKDDGGEQRRWPPEATKSSGINSAQVGPPRLEYYAPID